MLHLAGAVAPHTNAYVSALAELAKGLPVVFHYDLSADELHTTYSRSSIYWHAKGFGVPTTNPEGLEHFGNTPIEAMSAGCVPVVFDAGGLRESVDHGVNGFRWSSIGELKTHTLRLVHDPALLASMSLRAARVDERFGVEPFLRILDQVVDETLCETARELNAGRSTG